MNRPRGADFAVGTAERGGEKDGVSLNAVGLRRTQNWAKLVRLQRPRLEVTFFDRGLRRNCVSPSSHPIGDGHEIEILLL